MHELEPDRNIRADIFLIASLLTNAARNVSFAYITVLSTVGETHGAAVLMALQFSSLPSWAAPAFLLVGAAVSTHNRLSASRCHCTTVADSSAQGATRTTALLLS